MEINTKIDFVEGPFETETGKLISISKNKYKDVHLCFKSNMNIPFAKIKLHSRDTFGDASEVFDDADKLGEEICRRWNCELTPVLHNRDIMNNYNNLVLHVMKDELLGLFASWVVRQSPYDVPNIMEPLKAYDEFLSKTFTTEDAVVKFKYADLQKYISEEVFESIPEIEKLNHPKIDNGQKFSTCSRYHKTKADYDFIDLGALARNIFFDICRNHITQPL